MHAKFRSQLVLIAVTSRCGVPVNSLELARVWVRVRVRVRVRKGLFSFGDGLTGC